MNQVVEIPKGDYGQSGPCWVPREYEGRRIKPAIICNCGKTCNIGLHHVHADGTVTRSFYDSKESVFVEGGKTYSHIPGCGWHVWLKLKDWSGEDFPPVS